MHRRLVTTAALVLACATALSPARADEFTDVLQSALKAYDEGDIKVAGEELDYASKLLSGMKAAALGKYLPAAPAGWTREDAADGDGTGMAMAMFGGGTTAAATYRKGDTDMTLTLVANSAMASGLGAMLTGLAGAGGTKPLRIQRTEFALNDGELQGVVDSKILVSVGGSATVEEKTALVDSMDLRALADF